MTRKEEFKRKLARVFDSDLHTTQWDNLVDYLIIALIIISTIAVFISTFDVPPAYLSSKPYEELIKGLL